MAESFKSCSFCGKGENRVHSMFSAGTANICDECVCYCYEMIYGPGIAKAQKKAAKKDGDKSLSSMKLLKPRGWCYEDTAAYGHFGRDAFPWERLDKVAKLNQVLGR